MKALIKRALVPKGRKLRSLRGGIARGQLMEIDLQSQLQRYLGLDEHELLGILAELIPSCSTLVDVGANDGYYTIGFLASPAGKVISCEPGPASEQLLANAAANGHAVSDRFQLEKRLVGNGTGEVGLGEILERSPRPVLIKVDVDGAEEAVLRSIEGYPFLNDVSWVVETHSSDLERSCQGWFSSHGYETKIIKNAWWRRLVPEQRPLEQNRWIVATPAR